MPFSVGACLGSYEVLARFTAGGMGDSYKARDTRPDRINAIKVWIEKVSERLEREARAHNASNASPKP
jgi:hypothetical protein